MSNEVKGPWAEAFMRASASSDSMKEAIQTGQARLERRLMFRLMQLLLLWLVAFSIKSLSVFALGACIGLSAAFLWSHHREEPQRARIVEKLMRAAGATFPATEKSLNLFKRTIAVGYVIYFGGLAGSLTALIAAIRS